ncbi:hypothetical protein AFLA_005427 [Aspergillus flavus NRRL3357]|nr:hypothetical protein AFLA_005427 [Aspergillus flavus NRRL3357]
MLQNLYDISGAYPIIRVGGSTQNAAVYYPNQTEAIIAPFSSVAADQPSHSFLGPSWLESFRQFPNGTQYIYGLNFFNPVNETYLEVGNGLDQCVLEANAAHKAMGDSLYAFEIGNEVDGWGNDTHRPGDWTVQSYVDQWNEMCLSGTSPSQRQDRLECSKCRARWYGFGQKKAVADHEYMGANCHYTGAGPTIETTLFDRTNMLSRVWYHDYLGNATANSGIDYVIGETNSISCQGAFNISDVMASAVWAVDYVMYLSSLKVSRVHFHMGTRYRYSPWQPIFYNDSAAHVKLLYYGNLFNAAVFAGGNKQTEVLVNETNFGAYAVYTSGKLDAIVAVNLNMWNSTFDPISRPYTALALPDGWNDAKVSRLTSPGVDIADNITFAGQYIDDQAQVVGRKTYDKVTGGKVLVGAGEAVLVHK